MENFCHVKILAKRVFVFFLIFALFFSTPSVFAREAKLENIIVTNTRDNLLLYLSVEGAFTEEMKKAVLSGVSTSFSFFISLNKVRTYWFDKEIADLTITHQIKYNSLKKEFTIRRSWEDDKPLIAHSFSKARRLMSEVDSLEIVPLEILDKNQRYQIRAKAELSKLTLPFYLHYILFFVSLWDFETDWYTVDFIY